MKILVIIPTYNEAQNIKKIIDQILSQADNIDVLIVDDNSPDKTYQIVKDMMSENERIKLIVREKKLGLGTAYIEGFKYAIKNNYTFIMEMDADFSHNPNDIPKFLDEIKENDLVIGSRYISGANVVNWPIKRLLLSYFASKYVQIITGMKVKDPTGGFKCFKTNALKQIDLDKVKSGGYSFQIELNYRFFSKKMKIKEIPIIFTERQEGHSKMSKEIIIEAIFMVWKLKFFNLIGKL